MALDYLTDKDIAAEASADILGNAISGVVATGADIFSTLYNSTVGFLGADDIKTEDLLSRVDKNALEFYNTHREGVEAASFIAGLIAPSFVTLKLINRAKAGLSELGKTNAAASVFTGQKSQMLQTELRGMFEAGKYDSAIYNTTMNKLYAAKIGEQVIDNSIFELAILGVLNAHPYMESYKEDPFKSAFLSIGLGAGIGSAFGVIGARNAVRNATSAIATEGIGLVMGKYRPEQLGATNAELFQTAAMNIQDYSALLKTDINKFTSQLTENVMIKAQKAKEEALMDAAPWLKSSAGDKTSPYIALRPLIEEMLSSPKFMGVHKIGIPNPRFTTQKGSGELFFEGEVQFGKSVSSPDKAAIGIGISSTIDDAVSTIDTRVVYYRPSTGNLYHKDGVNNIGIAADLKGFKPTPGAVNLQDPGAEFALGQLSREKASALTDAHYINELLRWEKVKPDQISSIGIAPDNLARQTGAVAWLAKQDPAMIEQIRFNVVSELPKWQEAKNIVAKTMKPGYAERTTKLIEDSNLDFRSQWEKRGTDYFGADSVFIDKAEDLIGQWIHGKDSKGKFLSGGVDEGKAILRRAMDAALHRTNLPKNELGNDEIARFIWEMGTTFREAIRKEADADGFVMLYRGTSGKNAPKTATSVESYTIKPNVAEDFGTPRLYRVPVDNIIGTVGSGNAAEAEVLVASSHYEVIKGAIGGNYKGVDISMPITGVNTEVKLTTESSNTLNGLELMQHYIAETERQVKAMIADGSFSIDEITARLNIKEEAVLAIMADVPLAKATAWSRIGSAEAALSSLDQSNRLIALQGNPNALNRANISANLDARMLGTAHQQIVEQLTAASKSDLASGLVNIYNPTEDALAAKEMMSRLDALKQNLGEMNNQLIKSPFWQTMDMALRHIKDGELVTYLGKRVSDYTDAQIKKYLEPLGTVFRGLNKETQTIEFSAVYTKYASLSGWRKLVTDPDTGFGYFVQREERNGAMMEVPVRNINNEGIYYIRQPEVVNAILATDNVSQELLRLHNLQRKLRGHSPVKDLGTYLPPISLVNTHYSYVIDATGKRGTSVLVGNSASELAGLEAAFKEEVLSKNPELSLVSKSQQEDYNFIHGYMDGERYVTYANNLLKHGGSSALAIVPGDARLLDTVIQGFEQQIISGVRKFHETYLSDITEKLDVLSGYNQRFVEGQPVKGFNKAKAEDAAKTVKNALLGVNNLDQFTTWKGVNDFFDMMLTRTSRNLDTITQTFSKTNNLGSAEHFEKLNKELAAKGIEPVWESFDLYAQSIRSAPVPQSKRLVSVANGLLSTLQLRMGDLAYPLVNMLSLPILTHGELMAKLPKTILPNGTSITLPLQVQSNGIRRAFNPAMKEIHAGWEADHHMDQTVRQFTDLAGALKSPSTSKGMTAELLDKAEAFQKSKFVEIMAKPADFTEKLTRFHAMNTGFEMAKVAYEGISDRGATIYAVSFADRTIGNYYSAQRPVLFQGSLGSGISLYMTYMTTFAQHVYRGIERGQFKVLTNTMLAQAGIFGVKSWPGFDILSQAIGNHLSDQNYDLTTGTYRALGDPIASLVLYGMPSMMGPALYTRGDVTPRVPTFDNLAIVNTTVGMYNALGHLFNGLVNQPGMSGKLQASMEALSLQTVSRPIARLSEIVAGESITRKGQTVAMSDDVWSFNGVFSRLLAARPMEEQVTRDAVQLHSFYGAADYDNRQKAVNKLRIAVRSKDGISDELLETVAGGYLRHGGSSKGWTSVMNEIMTRTEEGTSYDLLRKLEPNSPLRRMIKDAY